MHQTENDTSTMEKSEQCSANNSSVNSSCSSKNSVPLKSSLGRYCHIVKRPDFDGYGFNLHSEKVKLGQYIGKVDTNSPAEAAGLREGDQIIEVNGVNIGVETHKQVVQRIKAISNEVRLLLIDPNTESGNINTKSHTNIPEKSTISSKGSTNAATNPKSPSKLSTAEANLPPVVPATEVPAAETAVTSANPKDHITSITMASTISQSTNINVPIVDATDFVASTTNGHHTKANGRASESLATTTTPSLSSTIAEDSKSTQQQHANSSQNNATNNKTGLNLNLTAAEMRAKLLAKKKFDPKNESVDLKKKFDIIQKL